MAVDVEMFKKEICVSSRERFQSVLFHSISYLL